MHGLQLFGEYVLEIFVISLLIAASALLILPSIPMIIGVVGVFKTDKNTRRFKDIFTTIGSNIVIIVLYTLFELVIIVFPILNIYFFNTHPENINYFVLAVCWVALVVGAIYFVHAPIIIVNMKVTFRQLLYNGFMLIFGGLIRSVLAVGMVAGIVAIILYYPYVVPLTLYLFPFLLSKLLTENFLELKAKATKTSVYELKKNIGKDDYLNENGEINHDDKNK